MSVACAAMCYAAPESTCTNSTGKCGGQQGWGGGVCKNQVTMTVCRGRGEDCVCVCVWQGTPVQDVFPCVTQSVSYTVFLRVLL